MLIKCHSGVSVILAKSTLPKYLENWSSHTILNFIFWSSYVIFLINYRQKWALCNISELIATLIDSDSWSAFKDLIVCNFKPSMIVKMVLAKNWNI